MTTVHDLPASAETRQPSAPWPPAGNPPGSGGWGEGPGGPPPRRHRGLRAAALVGLAVLSAGAGAGTALAVRDSGGQPLTTAQIAARVDPGLVDITTTLGYQHGIAKGTGMVATSSGEVLTNNHVVEGATAIRVRDVGNGRSYRATVIGYDRSADVAVLRLWGASGLRTVTFGDSSQVAVGQRVVALGNAGGLGGTPAVAAGRVTALRQSIVASDAASGTTEHLHGLIRTDAPIQPGDSGGPLVNSAGQVIGMDTAASSGFQFLAGSGHTTAFAVPASQAEAVANQIVAGRSSATVHIGRTAFLGVEVTSPGGFGFSGGSGALVAGVLSGTPAARAGLAAGDEITSVGGHPVASPDQLQRVMNRYHPGERATVGWTDQAGQAHTATVVFAAGPVG
jgi:S1-C subfamily serine protease